jgi:hypothetical protein
LYKFYFDYKYKGKIYHNIGYHRNAQIYSINDSLDVFIKQNPQISKAGSLEFRKRNPLWLLGLLLLVLIGIFIIYRSEKSNLFLISLLNNGYITIGKYVSHSYESNSECERFVYSYYFTSVLLFLALFSSVSFGAIGVVRHNLLQLILF